MTAAEHDVVTIDTHYTDRATYAAAYLMVDGDHAAFVETNTSAAVPRLLEALEAAGRTPAQVQYIIITHIHLDHAGGAGTLMQRCPNATLLAHPKAATHAIDPSRIVAGARQVYGDALFDQLYAEVLPVPKERVRALDDGVDVELGKRTLSFIHTRGHANHHFCLHDSSSEGVFTGDSFGLLYPQLQRNGTMAFPSTTPTDFDADAAHASIDRIVAFAPKRVFPTHFGEHQDIDEAATQLHRQLDAYAKIVDEGDRSGREGSDLDSFCVDGVRTLVMAELERVGLAGDTEARSRVAGDIQLNAQGLSFAVSKLRYKRTKA